MLNLLGFCEVVELGKIHTPYWTNVYVSVLLFVMDLGEVWNATFSPFPDWFFKNIALMSLLGVGIMYFYVFKILINKTTTTILHSEKWEVLFFPKVCFPLVLDNPLPLWTNSFSTDVSRPAAPFHIIHWMFLKCNSEMLEFSDGSNVSPERVTHEEGQGDRKVLCHFLSNYF